MSLFTSALLANVLPTFLLLRFLLRMPGQGQVTFSSPHPLPVAVARLSAVSLPENVTIPGSQWLCGHVAAARVKLRWKVDKWHNSFSPQFVGHFSGTGETAVLRGSFGVALPVRLFMFFWFYFINAVTILIVIDAVERHYLKPVGELMFSAILSVGGALIVYSGRSDAADEIVAMSSRIRGAICEPAAADA